jgi:nitrite reductase (NADH) small subunit
MSDGMSEHWVRMARTGELPLREGRVAMVGDLEIALFHLGDRVLAVDNRCPHEGGPLCDGIVTGESVVCPLHAWKVRLGDGQVERPAAGKNHCVRTYETRVEDGIVAIRVPALLPSRVAVATA